ncbi:Palmitoyltransferase [Balamuthia mandrillaris]
MAKTKEMNPQGAKRVYEVWPANNKFFCGGRGLSGPDRRYFYLALALLLIPMVLYCGLSWPWLLTHIELYISVPLFVLFLFLGFINLSFMLITAFRDPGIVPRGLPIEYDPENPWEYDAKKPADTARVYLAGEKIRVKYCQTCNIYRPPRCIHCAVCNNCVERFDHHCPWVGNCIGRRNYQTFLAFVWGVNLSSLYALGLSITHITLATLEAIDDHDDATDRFLHVLEHSYFSMAMILYTFLALGLVGFLGGFHCLLACSAQTTNEKLKGLYNKRKNPHSKGEPCLNVISLFCDTHWPSSHKFRSLANEEERRKHRRKFWDIDEKEKEKRAEQRRKMEEKKQKKEERRKSKEALRKSKTDSKVKTPSTSQIQKTTTKKEKEKEDRKREREGELAQDQERPIEVTTASLVMPSSCGEEDEDATEMDEFVS